MMRSSNFHIVNTLVSLANVDGHICDKEKAFIRNIQKNLLSSEESEIIDFKFTQPDHFFLSFSKLENREDKNRLIDYSRVLFNIDDNYSLEERSAYHTIKSNINESHPLNKQIDQSKASFLLDSLHESQKVEEANDFINQISRPLKFYEIMIPEFILIKMISSGKTKLFFSICVLVLISYFILSFLLSFY